MMHGARKGIGAYILQPFLVVLVLTGFFGLVWLRSNIISVEYKIGMLERERESVLRERKALIAKRAAALSIGEVEARGIQAAGLLFPDRRRVLHVKRDVTGETYRVSIRGNSKINEQKGGNP